ncbi:hypothetical protein F5888DRAFT_1673488 [Russula emetica]|nr:hypothetical protein F5888DRAFT_1673488 [Russula emetica]
MHKPPVRRQIPVTDTVTPTASGVSGGETVSSGVNPGSSLLLGASGSFTNSVSDLLTTDLGVTSTSSPTPNTSSSSSSTNTSPSVPTGSVLAITVAVFLVLIGAMFLIYTYIKRRTAPRTRHPLSRGPQPAVRGAQILRDHGKDKQRNNSDHRGEGKNNSSLGSLNPRAKSPDSAKFGLFEKDPSIRSITDEKANISTSDDHHFDPSAMASFAKYQVGPVDDFSILSHPHRLASHEGGSPPISWDGGTVTGDPFASLHASVSDTMSPTAVVVRQTPLTTDSAQHRWESAEVVMMDEAITEPTSVYSDMSHNPFNDDAAPRGSTSSKESVRRSNSNPFFNASQHNPFARSTRSRASSVSTTTAKRSRSYSASSRSTVRAAGAAAGAAGAGGPESENALVSLLAALRPTPVVSDEQNNNRSSMRTTLTSLYTPAEGGDDPATPQAL